MSLLFRKAEQRSISFQDVWGSGSTPTVRGDSQAVALSLIPVYSATGLIADMVAASPWAAYEKRDGFPVKVDVQPQLLTDPGVNGLDLYSWKHQMTTSKLLHGNAYGFIAAVDSRGMPSKVAWLRPDKMRVDETGPRPRYFYNGSEIERSLLIHIPLYVVPGSVVGLSPLGLFRAQIETGVEAQRVAKNSFKRGSVPAGILRNTKKALTPTIAEDAKKRFLASTSSNEPFVTGDDWDYKAVGLPASDVNFLMGMKLTANQFAAVYRVAPEDAGGESGGSSLTYATLEMNQLNFNSRTVRPITTRDETVLNRYLPVGQYVKSNLDVGVRSDLATRYAAHGVGIDKGFLVDDEVRALEERPPLTDAQRAQILAMRVRAPQASKSIGDS